MVNHCNSIRKVPRLICCSRTEDVPAPKGILLQEIDILLEDDFGVHGVDFLEK